MVSFSSVTAFAFGNTVAKSTHEPRTATNRRPAFDGAKAEDAVLACPRSQDVENIRADVRLPFSGRVLFPAGHLDSTSGMGQRRISLSAFEPRRDYHFGANRRKLGLGDLGFFRRVARLET